MDEKELIVREKTEQLRETAELRTSLMNDPKLHYLFFELTLRCNENCVHCGSRCGDVPSEELPAEVFIGILDKVAEDFKGRLPMLCITGGEPLLRKEFFEIAEHAKKLGYMWGITSNGTLITKDVARRLKEAGMATISVSLDGTKEYHDAFRRSKNAYERTVEGLRNLMEQGFEEVQVTTVVTPKNLPLLDEMFRVLCETDVDSWRLVGVEPIGRALEHPELFLSKSEQLRLLQYIRDRREEGYPVAYACSHWLGLGFEREVRDSYFFCDAGLRTASIMANGDIGGCLDIDRRPETIQGNVLKDDFTEVWKKRFGIFRKPLSSRCAECAQCPDEMFCRGGSAHTWDYVNDRQLVCFRRDW
ncbi:MAG: radical SAM protein [Paludibacteraceae bacterium]|nr:radical SAM protein [Paludibacteraceae bacterium]